VCATWVDVATPLAWRCPRATPTDRRHVLELVEDGGPEVSASPADRRRARDPNPFIRFGPRLAWWAFARAHGMSNEACEALTRQVAGEFRVTPYGRSESLSAAVGLEVWVKDETGNVAGSHKARHLASILLHLRAAEELGLLVDRPPLAIASCGNAALAASTLAHGVGWPIEVYVPEWIDDGYGDLFDALGAQVHRCTRSPEDPPGDPAVHRFREAVAAGAIPFSVQGPENALCLDGGRTLGWEMCDQAPDRVFVQVGGGAFAASVGAALGPSVKLHAVQAEGCAPLARAWNLSRDVDNPEQRWAELMTPWDQPGSIADGILDDETYDWIGVVRAMRASGGEPVVASEAEIVHAHRLARSAGFAASHTGSAGLAGVLAARHLIGDDERVAVVMSGVAR
jgi:threonine synthase